MDILERLSRVGTFVGATIEFLLITVLPALIPRYVFDAAVRYLPVWGQAIISALLVSMLIAALGYLTGAKFEGAIRTNYERRQLVWFPLAASLGTLLFAMYVFASAHWVLIAAGVTSVEREVSRSEWSLLADLYLWHFLAAVPGVKIPETLRWPVPFEYSDRVAGVLIILFQAAVIIPVIGVFRAWIKVRQEFRSTKGSLE